MRLKEEPRLERTKIKKNHLDNIDSGSFFNDLFFKLYKRAFFDNDRSDSTCQKGDGIFDAVKMAPFL